MKMDISKAKKETMRKIGTVTDETMNKLIGKWKTIFSETLVISNITLLAEHVQTFCDEIFAETERKEETILEKIESLRNEHRDLQKLLNVEIPIPTCAGPLLNYQHDLDGALLDLREELTNRKLEIKSLLLQQESLCDALDEPKLNLFEDPLSTREDVEFFKKNLAHLESLHTDRQMTVSQLRNDIKKLCKNLEISFNDEPGYSLLYKDNLKLSQSNLNRVLRLKSDLEAQQNELIDGITNMKKKLNILWDCLKVSADIQKKFNGYVEYNQTVYDKLKAELNRRENEKRQHMKVFVERIRQDIKHMWELTLKSDEERKEFKVFYTDHYNEDLLQLHELELDSLKDFYDENKKLFDCYKQHTELFDRMIALEKTENNSNRYKNRGGQLLKEEHERKAIARDLPKIHQEIKDLNGEFERIKGKPFMVFGESIVDVIDNLYKRREEQKQLVASNRKLNTTSVNNRRTPLSVNRTGYPQSTTLKRIASTPNVMPNPKKQLLEVPGRKAKRELFSDNNENTQKFVAPKQNPKVKGRKSRAKPVIASLIVRRQSRRLSKNSSRPSKPASSVESSVLDYADFQTHLSSHKLSRSSELPRDFVNTIKPIQNMQPTSSMMQTSPSPRSKSSKKTKHLPIIF